MSEVDRLVLFVGLAAVLAGAVVGVVLGLLLTGVVR